MFPKSGKDRELVMAKAVITLHKLYERRMGIDRQLDKRGNNTTLYTQFASSRISVLLMR